tara:strand:+ start:3277 stop:3474 length:198 start_codon:yes stop_codon:yes gene_type:complete
MSKETFYWENDTWGVIHTEQGETLEINLHTCDVSGKQYISFYPEQTEDVKKSMKVLASYEVNQKI